MLSFLLGVHKNKQNHKLAAKTCEIAYHKWLENKLRLPVMLQKISDNAEIVTVTSSMSNTEKTKMTVHRTLSVHIIINYIKIIYVL